MNGKEKKAFSQKKNSRRNIIRLSVLFTIIAESIIFAVLIIVTISHLKVSNNLADGVNTPCTFNVVVTGESDFTIHLSRIYDGAKAVSEKYDSSLTLFIPPSRSGKKSIQGLVNFSSYSNADGLILWNADDNISIKSPYNRDGILIPLVLVGFDSKNISKTAFVGVDFYKEGISLAERLVPQIEKSNLGETPRILFVNSFNSEFESFRKFQEAFSNSFKNLDAIKIEYLLGSFENAKDKMEDVVWDFSEKFSQTETDSSDENASIALKNLNSDKLFFICLSEADTLYAASLIQEFGLSSSVYLVGFGDAEDENTFFENGFIDELFGIDYEKLGEEAMNQIFRRRNSAKIEAKNELSDSECVYIPFKSMRRKN